MMKSDGFDDNFLLPLVTPRCTLIPMTIGRDRIISITLSDAEWQQFVSRHPQPVTWLLDRIRRELEEHRAAEAQQGEGGRSQAN